MTPLTTNKGSWLAVEVPEDAEDITIYPGGDMHDPQIRFYIKVDRIFHVRVIPPHNTYTFLFTTKNATEEDWERVIESWDDADKYKDYCYESDHGEESYPFTAIESGHSLMKANNLDVNKNYALIKIEKNGESK